MSRPIVIQIIGMHGVGKTTVAAKAAELFALMGLRVATLDVDHFAHAYLAKPVASGMDEESYRAHIAAVADAVKDRTMHAIGLGSSKTTNAIAIKAVDCWINVQDADVVLLEMHWPLATSYYRDRDDLWLVTATEAHCRSHIEKQYGEERVDGLLKSSQKNWRENSGSLPRQKRLVPNANRDIASVQKRLAHLIECLYHSQHRPLTEPN